MDEREMTEALMGIVYEAKEDDAMEIRDLRTFEELGVWTSNAGFVVRMEDGSEFHVTVVRSK